MPRRSCDGYNTVTKKDKGNPTGRVINMAKLVYNYGLVCIYSVFSLFAVLYSYSDLAGYVSFRDSINSFFVLFMLTLFFLFYKFALSKISNFSALSFITGIFAGVINVLCRNFMLYNNLIFFYRDKYFAIVFSLLAAIGYGLIYASVFEIGWKYLPLTGQPAFYRQNSASFILFDKRSFIYPFIVIFVLWIPYFVVFYPGIVHWDAVDALLQYYGLQIWTSQHPVVSVLLMGYTMDIGKFLGSDNLGCVIYIVLQYIICSLTLAYSFVFYNKWKTPYIIRWVTLLLFSLLPVVPMFVLNEVKDTFYYVAVLWMLFIFIKCLEQCDNRMLIKLSTAVIFLCCLRKEGIVICVSCLLALLIVRNKIYDKWKRIALAVFFGVCVSVAVTNLASVHYNVKPASMREALSLPVQQTARFIRDHGKDITKTEWEVLNTVFNNKAGELGNVYNPNRSDEVKYNMVYTLNSKLIKQYLRVWLTHFIRHPGCYCSAAFNQMYGYFYIERPAFKIYEYDIYTNNFKYGHMMYTTKVMVTDNPNTTHVREKVKECFIILENAAFTGTLFHPATYIWLLFFALTMLIHFKQHKYLFFFVIPLVNLAVCCASPINADLRYSFPIILSSFFLIAFSVHITGKKLAAV